MRIQINWRSQPISIYTVFKTGYISGFSMVKVKVFMKFNCCLIWVCSVGKSVKRRLYEVKGYTGFKIGLDMRKPILRVCEQRFNLGF